MLATLLFCRRFSLSRRFNNNFHLSSSLRTLATVSIHPFSRSSTQGHIISIYKRFSSKKMSLSIEAPTLGPMVVPSNRLLMGPGPSNTSKATEDAQALPVLGHMHPEFFKIMDDVKGSMQYMFQTANKCTLVISGPGHLGMEAVFVNLLQPGETVLVGVNGLWGNRASDLGHRIGAKVARMEKEVGGAFSLQEIEEGLKTHKPKVLFLVHSESSTGVMQPLEGVGALCKKYGCLFAVDTVASLGGVPFYMDKWGVDAVYTGSQKVIGAPPGLSPCSFSPAAVAAINSRTVPVKSYLLDMTELSVYWDCVEGKPRFYHHTPPITLFYGLREALAQVIEEGLPALWERHANATARLHKGLQEDLNLRLFVEKKELRLPTVTTIVVENGVDWKKVTGIAMNKHNVEIAGGLGATVGKVWRIGVMGCNATEEKVDRVLNALKDSIAASK